MNHNLSFTFYIREQSVHDVAKDGNKLLKLAQLPEDIFELKDYINSDFPKDM